MLTEQSITAIIKTLHASLGKVPTNKEIREALGKGSFTQINPVLKRYKQKEEEKAQAAVEIPEKLSRYIHSALAEIWTTATQIATKALEEEKKSSRETLQKLEAEHQDALTEITRLEQIADKFDKTKAQLEETQAREIKMTAQYESLLERFDEKKSEISDLKKEVRELRKHNNDLDKKLVELASKK